jgi:hypothetical protein
VFIEARGGIRTCVVDQAGGGTTQTALIQTLSEERLAAEAPTTAAGGRLCGCGCIPNRMGGSCGSGPEFMRQSNLSQAVFDACHAMIAAHCR